MKGSWCILVSYILSCALHFSKADTQSETIVNKAAEATLSEDGKLNFTQLVTKYGQTVEQYQVVTEDGYILTVFRVPGPKPPVLLFHGIIDSCDTFVLRGNTSAVITLANAGYDVWIANNRGTLYGRDHVTLNPDADKEFWNYSFHEIGFYDLAAIIDFILAKTGYESICTIGHSQGTTAHLVLTSTRPEYNKKIKVFMAFAPVAFLDHLTPPLSLIADVGPFIGAALKVAGMEELLQNDKLASDLIKFVCSKGLLSYVVCDLLVLFPGSGFDPKRVEPDFLNGVVFGHYPRATSRKSALHFAQVYLRNSFAQYDYGPINNMAKYGSVNPPDYNLTAVTMDVALFIGGSDAIAKEKDVKRLRDSLSNVVHYKVMEPKEWSHVDFVWANDMSTVLYPAIFEILEEYN